ncbi:hypothetical protein SAMN05421774_10867 [Gemmobacter megaterium]|uniref:Uncharacterized protein n=1 Tax=Gemmobacter megaterium TaxID=1086013 RepID=A0A1N7QAY9_9RHOB|nr:hypothetical protein [Gemmobacter megaterium]GGE24221.1 hypothetical protein GCM10011345_32770 [Gemmobacter megaterium]SIT20040.1 hypothetical protein SAMN05421774_10867 [Gemmobacter megaterium]
MTDTTTETPNPNKALNAAGLPDAFSMDGLKAFLDEGEIAALTEGEDSVLAALETQEEPAKDETPQTIEAKQPEPEPEPAPAATAVPLPDVSAAQQALAEADTKLAELVQKYDDGDLTRAEWDAQQAELVQSKARAMAQIELAQTVLNQQQQARAQAWYAKLDAYHTQHPDLASEAHIDGWDAALRSVTGSAAYASLPMEKQIELAHRLYADHVEVTTGQSITRPNATKQAKPDDAGPRTDPRPEPPRTLTGLSGAEPGADADDGTFAAIDRMMGVDPERAEAMLARLPPERQAAYLN